jgi:hypothetical protein
MGFERSHVHSQQALAVYAESLAAGGVVALFGDSSLGLAERLTELGARSVHVWDPDPVRARVAAGRVPQGVTVHAYGDAGGPKREVDLAVVPDLGLFADVPEVIARSRDLVGQSGVVLLSAANRDAAEGHGGRAFEYYELFDLVARDFKGVNMIAELPFHGVALVALGDEGEAAEVSVDTQLAGAARVPQRFVVLASQRDVELDPYMVVELPGAPAAGEPEAAARLALAHSAANQAAALAESAAKQATALAESAAKQAAAHGERTAALEAALADRDRQLSELSSQVEQLRAAAESPEGSAAEVRRYEDMLGERAALARSLQVELERRDQMVRELVELLQEKQKESEKASPPAQEPGPADVNADVDADVELREENGRLRALMDSLALEAARRESDAQAMAWKVSELERRLEDGTSPASPGRGRNL